jgi:hypothetical protein
MDRKEDSSNSVLQLIWGIALVLAGVGVFVRIPQVMPRVEEIGFFEGSPWIVRFSFYILGILLIGGGAQKLVRHFRSSPPASSQGPSEDKDS